MSDSFALRHLGISAAAVLALALSACGGGGGGGPAAELAAAPASEGGAASTPVDGDSAAAGAPPRAGEGGGSPPVEPGAGEGEPGVPVGEGPGAGGPSAPGGGSTSPSAAAWHVFGEAGTGPDGAALVTAEDLAGISTTSLIHASFVGPNWGSWVLDGNLPNLSQSDAWAARGTRAAMAVRIGHNDAGQVSYRLDYKEGNPTRDGLVTTDRWTLDSEAAGTNVQRLGSGGRQGAMFRREDSEGNLWALVTTDVSGSGSTDWLATGAWAYAPAGGPSGPTRSADGGDESRGYRFGVFADGWRAFPDSPPFGPGSVAALTGTATYEGDAAGIYSRRTGAAESTRRNDLFSADASLAIDFSARTDGHDGSVAGRIHNIAIDGAPIAGNPEIALRGEVNGNEISPDAGASMTFGGASWEGDWGAALFGAPASDATGADRLPSSVAGTFGVERGIHWRSDGDAFIGAFGARRTAWTDSPEQGGVSCGPLGWCFDPVTGDPVSGPGP